MRALLTTDLHLTDRPEDEYRWKVFDKLGAQMLDGHFDHLFILGDLTEEKDNHSAELVNRLVRKLHALSSHCPISILKGNHDYRDQNQAFFHFLDVAGTDWPNPCRFFSDPDHLDVDGVNVAMIPHFKKWDDVKAKAIHYLLKADLVLCHQTFDKAKSESGRELNGPPSRLITEHVSSNSVPIIAGDVHTPQELGRVTYLGSPHPVDFGDDFKPRFAIVSKVAVKVLIKYVPIVTLRKVIIRGDSKQCFSRIDDLKKNDRCKLVVEMDRAQIHKWPELSRQLRKACEERGVLLASVEPVVSAPARQKETKAQPTQRTAPELFDRYCELNKISSKLAEAGRQLLDAAKDQ